MAREFGEQLLRLAQREAEPTPRLEASAALGHTLFCVGDYAAALTCLEGIVLINPGGTGGPGTPSWLGGWSVVPCPYGQCPMVSGLSCAGAPAESGGARSGPGVGPSTQSSGDPALCDLPASPPPRRAGGPQTQGEALLTLATVQGFPPLVGLRTSWRGWALAMQRQGEAGLAQMHQGIAAVAPRDRHCRGRSVWSCAPRRRGTPARSRQGCACWPKP
jgi:hypothetical protein